MATLTAFSTFHSICSVATPRTNSSSLTHLSYPPNFHLHTSNSSCIINGFRPLTFLSKEKRPSFRLLRSVEEDTLVPAQQVQGETEQADNEQEANQQQETVSIPVSPSDTLTMLFQVFILLIFYYRLAVLMLFTSFLIICVMLG